MSDRLDPEPIFSALSRHGVRFIVVGGYAATVHGVPVPPTADIDVVPERSSDNLARLVGALVDLDARSPMKDTSGSDQPPFVDNPPEILARRFWTLLTPFGPLDLVVAPTGFPGGYSDLVNDSSVLAAITADGTRLAIDIPVASVHHIYLSKKQAGRRKDLLALPALARAVARSLRSRPRAPKPEDSGGPGD
jgi:hypothetical protein